MEAAVPRTTELVDNVFEQISADGQVTAATLSMLHVFFKTALAGAVEIVDAKGVTRYECPSGRVLYQITGTSSARHHCLLDGPFCPCQSFLFSVVHRAEQTMCKHLIAARLAEACGQVNVRQVGDVEFAAMLAQRPSARSLADDLSSAAVRPRDEVIVQSV